MASSVAIKYDINEVMAVVEIHENVELEAVITVLTSIAMTTRIQRKCRDHCF